MNADAVTIVDGALTRELRRSVLRPELDPTAPLPGDDDPEITHFAVFAPDGRAVSTCWVKLEACPWRSGDSPAWHLRQMATAEAMRGLGLGSVLLSGVLQLLASRARTAEDAAAAIIWCHARERAVPFYARLGLIRWGPVFTDERHTIPHQRMWRRLIADTATGA
jgi:GNAT superfamily N-acetyltransferase